MDMNGSGDGQSSRTRQKFLENHQLRGVHNQDVSHAAEILEQSGQDVRSLNDLHVGFLAVQTVPPALFWGFAR